MADNSGKSGLFGDALKKLAEIAFLGLIGVVATATGLAPSKELTNPQNWPLWITLVILFLLYLLLSGPLHRAYLRWRVPPEGVAAYREALKEYTRELYRSYGPQRRTI